MFLFCIQIENCENFVEILGGETNKDIIEVRLYIYSVVLKGKKNENIHFVVKVVEYRKLYMFHFMYNVAFVRFNS